MHPILIEFGQITLYSYGFFIAAAFLLGMAWTMREAERKGLESCYVLDIGFYVLLGGILGARLLFVAVNPDFFIQDPWRIIKIWQGGLVFMGGALAAALFMIIYLRINNQDVLPWLDASVPGVALGLFVGWLGCLAAGCGYGKPADLPWSITFTHPDAIGPLFTAMHPVQLYQALAALACFLLVFILRNRFNSHGRLAGLFLIMYTLSRISIDTLRGDIRLDLGFISMNQALGLAVIAVGLVMLFTPSGHGSE